MGWTLSCFGDGAVSLHRRQLGQSKRAVFQLTFLVRGALRIYRRLVCGKRRMRRARSMPCGSSVSKRRKELLVFLIFLVFLIYRLWRRRMEHRNRNRLDRSREIQDSGQLTGRVRRQRLRFYLCRFRCARTRNSALSLLLPNSVGSRNHFCRGSHHRGSRYQANG